MTLVGGPARKVKGIKEKKGKKEKRERVKNLGRQASQHFADSTERPPSKKRDFPNPVHEEDEPGVF